MAYKIKNIQLRRDTTANWLLANPVLLNGEYAYATDTGYVTVGDGKHKFSELSGTRHATIRLPKSAIDDLQDVNTNTIYQLSANDDRTSIAFLSADGTLAAPVYTEVTSYTLKSWQSEIDDALQKAREAIASVSAELSPKIETNTSLANAAQETANKAKALAESLSAYVGNFEPVAGREDIDSVVKYVDYKVEGLIGAMHFRGVFNSLDEVNDLKSGDIAIVGTTEYVYDGTSWKVIGDEAVYETKADATAKLVEAKQHADDAALAAKTSAVSEAKEYTNAEIAKHHVPNEITVIEGTNSKRNKTCGVFANGIPVVIRKGVSEDIVDVWYDNDTKNVSFNHTDYPGGIMIYGGTGNEEDYPMHLPATSIRMESGKVNSIFAGSINSGNVGIANVIVNGGTIISGVIAGRSDGYPTVPVQKNHFNNIGLFNCTVNNCDKITMIYGGSNGYSTVDKAIININGGNNIGYVTAGGANGTTFESTVNINGGTVGLYQGVNRGSISVATLNVNGGTIDKCYAGGETTDKTVDGTILKSIINVLGGEINHMYKGTSGGTLFTGDISGKYVKGKIHNFYDDVKTCLIEIQGGSFEDLGELAWKDKVIQNDLSGEFNFDCGSAND